MRYMHKATVQQTVKRLGGGGISLIYLVQIKKGSGFCPDEDGVSPPLSANTQL